MAFPVPSHLPRKGIPYDISSQILSKVSSATSKSLNADLASSWIGELDETILQTKSRIHERLHADLPAFERQLSTSRSIQNRLHTLTENVEILTDAVSHPESGLIPKLLHALSEHSSLVQFTLDAEVTHESLSHLLKCRTHFNDLDGLFKEGKLPEAVRACCDLEKALGEAPEALSRSEVMLELKRQFRATKDRAEEQLSDALSRSVVISAREIVIRPSVQVRQSSTILTLPSVLSSLSVASLSNHLTTLRRDLTAHYIEYIVTQPATVSLTSGKDITGTPEHRLSVFPSPPNNEDRAQRLTNIALIFDFLDAHFFPALPHLSVGSFKRSLCKPLSTALLNRFLVPLLPSSLIALPDFLALVRQTVEVEEKYVVGMLNQDVRDREVKVWADGVATHYERKRRVDILEEARQIVVRDDEGRKISIEVIVEEIVMDLPQPEEDGTWGFEAESKSGEQPSTNMEEDRWGFDEDNAEEQDGWGFDDEAAEPKPETQHSPPPPPEPAQVEDEDPSDAWGWNEEDETNDHDGAATSSDADNNAVWDDPWADEDSPPEPPAKPSPQSFASAAPKRATRLEKLANKGKNNPAAQQLSIISPALVGPPPPTPINPKKQAKNEGDRDIRNISPRADVASAVEAALSEGEEFASAHGIFDGPMLRQRGLVLLQSAPSVFDLFRALYPVKFGRGLLNSAERSMVFANDCTYLSEYAARLARGERERDVNNKLVEVSERLEILGDSWREDSIDRQKLVIVKLLADAEGFMGTADQNQFDECEGAITSVLGQIRNVAKQWKGVMRKSAYFPAVGSLVDAALEAILDSILALPDITEVESHRLSELCRILSALEGIFMEDPDQPSLVVAYVPSWLKFSYLSEILEASLADVSYLFEEGALVDFEVHELVKLVRALFADTPHRSSTINKLMAGHPQIPAGHPQIP
ncbi:hypothetical protein EW146_g5425 [Bondarzewia mesenterica]|uniref:ZW10 C-terminal helical domain-containing protein n=1 Tax=Bondarzewia mesenterica TaxID=1095465 RepID=A0A4V3XEU7_9AGAM|nr:hypothetical protein EW146_g5425 [Bondarzewia mesenterica]